MNREDAEEAMEACNETDPFNVGRFLMMRWGKNVKRFVRQGTGGGIAISPTQKLADNGPIHLRSDASMEESASLHDDISARSDGMPHFIEMKPRESSTDVSKAATYQASEHQEDSIAIDSPIDMDRFHFISTVASFVAKDGSYLEKRLLKTEAGNPLFNFLSLDNASDLQRREHLFYRWRVYSFCQGDSHANWRREPFVMFHPNGRFWIPPDMNMEAARNEYTRKQDRAEGIRQRKETRQKVSKSQFLTGRQLERESQFLTGRQLERVRGSRRKGNRRGFNWDCGSKLTSEEMSQFDDLVRKRLTISRERICSAMAFCFEKSGSAREISLLLKNALLDESPLITVDMRIARLYLISDILFNSQQPGVRNAFGYRDALEKMAPQIFKSLGKHGGRNVGRMTMNKLRNAVSSVLSAWTEWSVYNPAFLDELEAAFEGREIKVTNHEQEQVQPTPEPEPEKPPEPIVEVDNTPRGGWTEVTEDAEESDGEPVDDEQTCNILGKGDSTDPKQSHDAEGDKTEATDVVHERTERRCQIRWDNNAGAASINDEIPSRNQDSAKTTPLAAGRDDLGDKQIDDVDGAAIEEEDIDGAPIVDDVDGASIDEEDIDGAPIVDDVDGAAIEEEDIDGAPIEEEAVDGSY